jgi:hypothetical protein
MVKEADNVVSVPSGGRVCRRTLIKRLLSETCVLEPPTKTKHCECEEYQPPLLTTILIITKSTGCTFPMGIFTSVMDSSPQTVLNCPQDGRKHCLETSGHIYLCLHGYTPQKREIYSLLFLGVVRS